MRNLNYHVHKGKGTLIYDYGKGTKLYEPWWAMIFTDQGIVDYYAWFCKKYGIQIQKGSAYGAHISFIRGEKPPNQEAWGQGAGEIEFWYAHTVRFDNDHHAWVDVWSDELVEIRSKLGLPPKPHRFYNGEWVPSGYHLTIGRL
jgi:hypothetical protein